VTLSYFDSSALLKRYLPELGSAWVNVLLSAETAVVSELTIPEVESALARRARNGDISREQQEAIYQRFLVALNSCVVVSVSKELIDRAAELLLAPTAPPRLRTVDALHLASAEAVFSAALGPGAQVGSFVSSDRALLEAARWAGLPAANPEDYP
jgi:predicted nucleic acid-binding protein